MTQYAYPPPPVGPRNGLGTAALVLGIVGLFFSFIPITGVIAWPLVVIGLVLGITGTVRARRGEATNRGMAITGIATSGAGLAICLLWTAAFGSAVHDLERQQALTGLPGTQAAVPADSAAEVVRLAFGETHVWSGGEAITVSAPSEHREQNPFLRAPDGKRHVSVDVTITNQGQDEYNVIAAGLTAQHAGRAAQQNHMAGDPLPNVELPPGGTTTFTAVYELGEQPGELQISAQPSAFSSETVYFTGQF